MIEKNEIMTIANRLSLPPLKSFWSELDSFFNWIEGVSIKV
jgi:hypothetical protein